ncbi:tetratricopeptide repeat-containing serine protease family protein [Cyanobium sp. A2C-AMD]|uniref:tetratricopeptide repeat-containing S1 family peptidase n=1 Tax=Cyanobium sp. A2C-AMD TaxID=2823695 RepID=UPI0020CDC5BF|nr:tetratricopeptide repeat-containing serine protease family protein [Cyanobium sp. A2C-AMD]MCP9877927.1 serine protease [Cyanobium sp. A2C-AMD]
MRRLPALVAALLLPAANPILLGTAVSTGALLVSQASAMAQSTEAGAKAAQAITVRIEGATQGSGVLVNRDGNRYTVLTAWHVVSSQRPGEELDIFVRDGSRQQLEQGSIKRLGEVDLAVLTFTSSNSYEVAQIGDIKSVSMGNPIWVSGFPLPSSAVPTRLMRFIKGDVIANATVAIPDGYQLLYDNQTLPGVSGGAVLNAQGQLVGIHGKAEKADQISESRGKAVATGTNQGVPISYYKQYTLGESIVASSTQSTTADDFLAQAALILSKGLFRDTNSEQDALNVISLAESALRLNPNSSDAYSFRARGRLTIGQNKGAIEDVTKALSLNPSNWIALFARGNAKAALEDLQGAIDDFSQVIAISPQYDFAYSNRGTIRGELGDKQGAIADYSQAISLNPQHGEHYFNRGNFRDDLGDKQGAITDYSQAISLNPKDSKVYFNRGFVRYELGDMQGAVNDYSQALAFNNNDADAYNNRANARLALSDNYGACSDYKTSASLGSQSMIDYLKGGDGAWCRNMP